MHRHPLSVTWTIFWLVVRGTALLLARPAVELTNIMGMDILLRLPCRKPTASKLLLMLHLGPFCKG